MKLALGPELSPPFFCLGRGLGCTGHSWARPSPYFLPSWLPSLLLSFCFSFLLFSLWAMDNGGRADHSFSHSLTHSARFTSLHFTPLHSASLHSTQLNSTQPNHSTHSLPQPLSTRPFVSTKDFTCGALRSFILNQMHYIVKHTNEPNLLKSFGCADPSCQTQHRCFRSAFRLPELTQSGCLQLIHIQLSGQIVTSGSDDAPHGSRKGPLVFMRPDPAMAN